MRALDRIGRYRLGPRLGAGGFAVVWLAHDESLDTPIAIKVMAENWAHRMDVRERFLTEARMLRRAASSRIVQVFDIGELPDGRPYFVMEFADRGTLADRTAAGPLPLVEALRLTAEVARGVAELHTAGIVHRDIKPSNVLIGSTSTGADRVMVADLGVAKSLAQASGLTMSVGSPGYMAPEQAEPNSGVDVRADVYSLGALGYYLLAGEAPGPAGRVVPLERLQPSLPAGVRRVLLHAMEPDRERRWPDAASLAVALGELADRLDPVPATKGARTGPRHRRRIVASVVALSAVVLVGAGIGVAELISRNSSGTVRVGASGGIEVDVPRAWSGQLVNTGWNPGVLQLSGQHAAGLLVADDVAAWPKLDANVNGVFVGLSADARLPAAVAEITHSGCRDEGERTYTSNAWRGQVRRWDHCGASTRSIDEIGLTGVGAGATRAYVQIRQDGSTDAVDTILGALRVRT